MSYVPNEVAEEFRRIYGRITNIEKTITEVFGQMDTQLSMVSKNLDLLAPADVERLKAEMKGLKERVVTVEESVDLMFSAKGSAKGHDQDKAQLAQLEERVVQLEESLKQRTLPSQSAMTPEMVPPTQDSQVATATPGSTARQADHRALVRCQEEVNELQQELVEQERELTDLRRELEGLRTVRDRLQTQQARVEEVEGMNRRLVRENERLKQENRKLLRDFTSQF